MDPLWWSHIFYWGNIFNPYIWGRFPCWNHQEDKVFVERCWRSLGRHVSTSCRRPTRAWPNSCGPCFHPWMFSQGVDTAAWYLNKKHVKTWEILPKNMSSNNFCLNQILMMMMFLLFSFLTILDCFLHVLASKLATNVAGKFYPPCFFSRYVECLAHVFSSSR